VSIAAFVAVSIFNRLQSAGRCVLAADAALDHLSPELRQLVEQLAYPYVAGRFGRRVASPSRALGR
jgi:hypothetical protein